MIKKNAFATSLVVAALALGVAATPAIALAQTAPEPSAVVAQCVDDNDLTDSFLIAISDAGYSVSEVTLTDADTYVNAYGEYVDYVGFNAYGTHFDYEVDHVTGAVCHWTMYAL